MTGADFRAIRQRLGLYQRELAQALGISPNEVYRKESGRRPVTQVQALALRALLLEAGLEARSEDAAD